MAIEISKAQAAIIAVVLVAVGGGGAFMVMGNIGDTGVGPGDNSSGTPSNGDELAPGVTDQGIQNASKILQAHYDIARNASSFQVTHIESGENSKRETVVTTKNGSILIDRKVYRGDTVIQTDNFWSNSPVTYHRNIIHAQNEQDQVKYEKLDQTPPFETVLQINTLGQAVNAFNFKYKTSKKIAGTQAHVYTITGVSQATDQQFKSVGGKMVVQDNGLVRTFQSSVTIQRNGSSKSFSTTYKIRKVNDVGTMNPSWVSDAKQKVAPDVTLSAQSASDKNYVTVTVDNGTLPKGSRVFFGDKKGNTYEMTVEGNLQSGTTLYVYVNSDDQLEVASSKPDPSMTKSFEEANVIVFGPDGTVLLDKIFK